MPSANDALLDAAIQHQIDLTKYSNAVVHKLIAILNRSDKRLFDELLSAMAEMDPDSFTIERLESMLGSVRSINAQAYAQVGEELRQELIDFTDYEASYQKMALESVLPAEFSVAAVNTETAYAGAMSRPFQGRLLSEALDDLEAGKAKKIRHAVAQGFIEGKTNAQIVREIRGTRAAGYADGLMEADRRHVQAVVQTAVAHTAAFTRERFMEANSEVLKGQVWCAKIDLRTSPDCLVRDGKSWTLDHKPIGHKLTWGAGPGAFHWCCRSSAIPLVKSFKELLGLDIDESQIPEGTRASLDGQLPANLSYVEWLAKQDAGRQDAVLGPTRGRLLREGKLPVEQMYSPKGEFLTLDELRKRDAEAFRKAGL